MIHQSETTASYRLPAEFPPTTPVKSQHVPTQLSQQEFPPTTCQHVPTQLSQQEFPPTTPVKSQHVTQLFQQEFPPTTPVKSQHVPTQLSQQELLTTAL